MEWSTGPLNLLLMDRYSWSDSPPWRCNSPICISIWWPPSIGSSRSRNRARIRRTNQAATASSANKPNQVIQLACITLASASRFPCPTWSASPARDSPESYQDPPRNIIQRAAVFGKGRCDPTVCRHLQKASHSLPIGPWFLCFKERPASGCRNSRHRRQSGCGFCGQFASCPARARGAVRCPFRPSRWRRIRSARRVLQGLIAIVATGDNKRGHFSIAAGRVDVKTGLSKFAPHDFRMN
jgi:hypothetical protein